VKQKNHLEEIYEYTENFVENLKTATN